MAKSSRQRSHASSISSLYSVMESRSSSQEPHPDHSSDLWTFSRSHPTGIQRPRSSRLGPLHCVHRQHGRRYLAQQGHLFEPDPMVLAFKEDSTSKKYVEHGPTHRSSTAAPPLTFRDINCHTLASPIPFRFSPQSHAALSHPQCCHQET